MSAAKKLATQKITVILINTDVSDVISLSFDKIFVDCMCSSTLFSAKRLASDDMTFILPSSLSKQRQSNVDVTLQSCWEILCFKTCLSRRSGLITSIDCMEPLCGSQSHHSSISEDDDLLLPCVERTNTSIILLRTTAAIL